MKQLRSILALALALACAPALAQVNPGTSPLTGAKGGTNNAFMQFTGPATSLKTFTLPNSSDTIATLAAVRTWTGAQSFTDGTMILLGSSSGSSTLKAPATGGGTATIFTGSDTFVGRATTDTLTNKTFDTAGAGNVFKIGGTAISTVTGTGAAVLATNPTFPASISVATNVAANTFNNVFITTPGSTATLTLGSAKIVSINNTLTLAGIDATTLTFQGTDTYVGRATTDTFTNKTFNCGSSGNVCTVRLGSDVTGQAPIGNGGTGQATAAAAISALMPTPVRAGDIVYWNGSNWVTLAGNNAGTLTLQENASGVPVWASVAGTGTVTSVVCGTGLSGGTITTSGTCAVNLTTATNVLGGDVALSNTALYFDGPSMAQGTSGTWWVSGTVTLEDGTAGAQFFCKLWDGTTVIASVAVRAPSTGNDTTTITLSGALASPVANIRISCRDTATTAGFIRFNVSGNSKDSSIFGHRIQ